MGYTSRPVRPLCQTSSSTASERARQRQTFKAIRSTALWLMTKLLTLPKGTRHQWQVRTAVLHHHNNRLTLKGYMIKKTDWFLFYLTVYTGVYTLPDLRISTRYSVKEIENAKSRLICSGRLTLSLCVAERFMGKSGVFNEMSKCFFSPKDFNGLSRHKNS